MSWECQLLDNDFHVMQIDGNKSVVKLFNNQTKQEISTALERIRLAGHLYEDDNNEDDFDNNNEDDIPF